MGALIVTLALVLGALPALSPLVQSPSASAASSDICGVNDAEAALTVEPSHGKIFYIDSSAGQAVDAAYLGYRITAVSATTNVWVEVTDFTGGSVSLANSRDSASSLGDLAKDTTDTAFFLVKAFAPTTRAQSHLVTVYSGKPGVGTPTTLFTCTFSFSAVKETIKANANKVTGISSSRVSGQTLGSTFTLTVLGETGTIGSGTSSPDKDMMWISPVARSSWPSTALRLESTRLRVAGNSNNLAACSNASTCRQFNDQLIVNNLRSVASAVGTGGSNKLSYQAVYTFRIVGKADSAVALIPVAQISSGTQIKHTNIPPSPPTIDTEDVTISAATTKTVSPLAVQVAPQTHLTYTVTVANSGSQAIGVDQIVDTPDAAIDYIPSTLQVLSGGVSVTAHQPAKAPGEASWVFPGPYQVPAASGGTPGTLTLTYRMGFDTCASGGNFTYANSAYAMVGTLKIGSNATSFQRQSVTGDCGSDTVVPSTPEDVPFTPEVETLPASSVTATGATLNGVVDPNGRDGAEIFYEHSTDPDLASPTVVAHSITPNPAATDPYSVPRAISGLANGTRYYYRVVVDYVDGDIRQRVAGDILDFRTDQPVTTPTITTDPATGVTQTAAVLNATVSPNQTSSSVQFVLSKTSSNLTSGTSTVRLFDDMSIA